MLSLRNQLLKNVIIHEQMSYIAHVKYMQLHSTAYQWWVSNWVIETRGQKVALWHAMCEHTGRINNCLALVCIKSPDWCPCCCHRSEGEPTSGHWNQGKWKWCRSGPLFWLWCHQQNKSGHSCPRWCLLTSGKRGTKEGKEKKKLCRKHGGYAASQLAWLSGQNTMVTCVKLAFPLFRSLQKAQPSIIHRLLFWF